MNNYNNSNNSNDGLTNSGFLILIAMALKTFSLVPTIYEVSVKKNASGISYITPAFLMAAFFILLLISLYKKFYVPILLFSVGIVSCCILIVQKAKLENTPKDIYLNDLLNYNSDIDKYETKIEEFESPYLI